MFGRSTGRCSFSTTDVASKGCVRCSLAKSDQDNIDKSDERDFKELAAVLLNASDQKLADLVESGKFQEVHGDGQNEGLQERREGGNPRDRAGPA
ncbi:type II toxin-antitoxin system RelE/ParE family toxin [Pararhodospirillum oryzae]|uniref:type II toxin-antitoxin system RelE/ParE family toxin n=1 Tax=Pararhodospirillum oryzae TaxID=478448 RepID=UPI0011BEE5E8